MFVLYPTVDFSMTTVYLKSYQAYCGCDTIRSQKEKKSSIVIFSLPPIPLSLSRALSLSPFLPFRQALLYLYLGDHWAT